MNIDSFKKLTEREKMEFITKHGNPLGERLQDQQLVCLYELKGFYVQVTVTKNKTIVLIDVFNETTSGVSRS